MSFLPNNLSKKSFQNVKNVILMHPKKIVLKKMLIKFLNVSTYTAYFYPH